MSSAQQNHLPSATRHGVFQQSLLRQADSLLADPSLPNGRQEIFQSLSICDEISWECLTVFLPAAPTSNPSALLVVALLATGPAFHHRLWASEAPGPPLQPRPGHSHAHLASWSLPCPPGT